MPDEMTPGIETADYGAADTGITVSAGEGAGTGTPDTTSTAIVPVEQSGDQQIATQQSETTTDVEPKEDLSEFHGIVNTRLRSIAKQSPQLAAALNASKDVRNSLEAVFRRDFAYRELFPTVAEARALREALPNGKADLDELLSTVREVEDLDRNVAERSPDGSYPGHTRILRDIWDENKDAAGALMRTAMESWPRYDSDGYNSYFSQVIGTTFANDGIPAFMETLRSLLPADNQVLVKMVDQLDNYVKGFMQPAQKTASPEQQRLQSERARFDTERQQRNQEDLKRFDQSLKTDSIRLHMRIVDSHPLVKQLAKLPEARAAKIKMEIARRINQAVTTNQTFMGRFRPMWQKMDMKGCLALQEAFWKQPWILDRFVRQVIREEQVQPRATGQPTGQARNQGAKAQPGQGQEQHTRSYQEDGRWMKPNGKPFSMEEILLGKHLE